MPKELFKAELDEAETIRKNLQSALDCVDEANSRAISTAVMSSLKDAHHRICLAITFMTPDRILQGPGRRATDMAPRAPVDSLFGSSSDRFCCPGMAASRTHISSFDRL